MRQGGALLLESKKQKRRPTHGFVRGGVRNHAEKSGQNRVIPAGRENGDAP